MRFPCLTLLSFPVCALILILSGCGGSFVTSSNSSSSAGSAPTVVAVGEQANGVAPNRSQYVQFNEPMAPSTINGQTILVADSSGRPVSGTVTYNANFEVAGFQPNPALAGNASYTLTITTGVASAQGVHMAAPYTYSFTTRASTDASPIYVKNVSPFPDASCVSPTTPIVITFNEGADVSTLNSTNIVITTEAGAVIPAKIGYNVTTASVTLTPTAPLPSGSITVTVDNVADAAGVKMTSPFTWTFTTTCGGSGSATTQYIATIVSDAPGQMTNGQLTIDTAGDTTVQVAGTTPNTTYTVQFCPAVVPSATSFPPCVNIMTISTDASGNATSTAKFPNSGDWAGDFSLNDAAGKAQYSTYLTGAANQTYLAALLPLTKTNNGAAVLFTNWPQEPLSSGSVSYSNGVLQITVKGAAPSASHYVSETETVYVDGSGSYGLGTFTTDSQGNGSMTTNLSGGAGGDLFQVGLSSITGTQNGFIGGFTVP